MKRKALCAFLSLLIVTGIAVCASYYQVKDPSSGSMYYTRNVDERKGGAIVFEDARTGGKVTLQNSELIEIPKDKFNEAIRSSN